MAETLIAPTKLTVRTAPRKRMSLANKVYADVESGERIEVTETTLIAGDLDFQKIWIANILAAVDEISNAKMKVLWYLLGRVDPHTNMLLETTAQVIRGCGVSKNTVIRTLKVLQENDIIRRQTGVVFLNPNVMMKGPHGKRRALLIKFEQMPLPLFAQSNDLEETA